MRSNRACTDIEIEIEREIEETNVGTCKSESSAVEIK